MPSSARRWRSAARMSSSDIAMAVTPMAYTASRTRKSPRGLGAGHREGDHLGVQPFLSLWRAILEGRHDERAASRLDRRPAAGRAPSLQPGSHSSSSTPCSWRSTPRTPPIRHKMDIRPRPAELLDDLQPDHLLALDPVRLLQRGTPSNRLSGRDAAWPTAPASLISPLTRCSFADHRALGPVNLRHVYQHDDQGFATGPGAVSRPSGTTSPFVRHRDRSKPSSAFIETPTAGATGLEGTGRQLVHHASSPTVRTPNLAAGVAWAAAASSPRRSSDLRRDPHRSGSW